MCYLLAGITDKNEGGPFLLEAKQGDTISGNVSRHELARIVATALRTPEAAGLALLLLITSSLTFNNFSLQVVERCSYTVTEGSCLLASTATTACQLAASLSCT